MEKEFKALEDLSKQEIIVKKGIGIYMDGSVQTMPHKTTVGVEFKGHIETIKQALTELKQIKEANTSEAMECLEKIEQKLKEDSFCYEVSILSKRIDTIKAALLKSQENAKALELIKPHLRLMGNCLQARAPFVRESDSWVFVKEITDVEELEVLKRWMNNGKRT